MRAALELVRLERVPAPGMLERVRDLPDLDEVREEFGAELLNAWVDALEKLHAGITFAAGSRSPVIDALFPHVKFPQLRRASREAVTEYAALYERRLKSSYVTRLLAQDELSLVHPVVDQVAAAHAQWLACYAPAPLPEEEAVPLREGLVTLGRRLDIAVRQARLLAEAALTPVREAFDASGLALKPKRRPGRGGPLEETALDASPEEGAPDDASSGSEPSEAHETALDAEPDSEEPPAPEAAVPGDEAAAGPEAAAAPKAPRRSRKKAAKPADTEG